MINQLTPDQITLRWDALKYPLTSAYISSNDDDGRRARLLEALIKGHFIAMHIFKQVPVKVWKDAIDTLKVFAKNNNCIGVVGSTPNKKIVRLMKILGGRVEYVSHFDLKDTETKKVTYDEIDKEVLI